MAGKTILVVDDYKSLRELTATMLRASGYRVFTAPDGKCALNLAAAMGTPRIDLLLTDYEMPEMRGDELARAFRHTCPAAKIVLMSNSIPLTEVEISCHLLAKPFRIHELIRSVEEAFMSANCR